MTISLTVTDIKQISAAIKPTGNSEQSTITALFVLTTKSICFFASLSYVLTH